MHKPDEIELRKLLTVIGQVLPGIASAALPLFFGDDVPPIVVVAALVLVGLVYWAIYWIFIEPRLHPTMQELKDQGREMREAIDKMINYRFISDGADHQIRPVEGLSPQQMFIRHAPADFRAFWYEELGLPPPPPRKDRAR